jgi:predicted PurR-regulated permease PerM
MPDRADEHRSRDAQVSAWLRLGLIALLVLLAWWLVDVLLLVFAGVLVAVLLRAPVDWLSARTRLSPNLALVLVFVVLALGLGGTGVVIAPEIGHQLDELTRQVPEAARELAGSLERYGWGRWLLARIESAGEMAMKPEVMQGAGRVLSSTIGALTGLFTVAVVGLWVTLQPRLYIDHGLRLLPVAARARARAIAGECGRVLQRWLLGSFLSMAIVFVATWIGLWALGIPLALVLALLAGAMVFIPNFGPLLSAIPALLLALMQSPQTVLWVALLYVGVQIVDNTMTTPIIQRHAVSIPPALMMFAQVAMGVLAGALGVIVAVPLTALAIVLVRRIHVDPLEAELGPSLSRPDA